jgi:hypothetical protein
MPSVLTQAPGQQSLDDTDDVEDRTGLLAISERDRTARSPCTLRCFRA